MAFSQTPLYDFDHAAGSGESSSHTVSNFKNLNSVKNLRNQVGADVVSGILGTNSISFPHCGNGFAQTLNSSGLWTVGAGFSEYAYNITQQFCITYDNTFTHEFGHNIGANQQRSEHSQADINTATNNGYPYAFAYASGSFFSIVSSAGNESRSQNFSNPNVQVNGITTGIANLAHNQRVIDELTVFVTNYRQRPDLIFANGFE